MPISTSSFDDNRDNIYSEYDNPELYDQEVMTFPGLTCQVAEGLLKRLGGGVAEKLRVVEGIGWQATMTEVDQGVEVDFRAHDELLDDLIRRFEEMADRATS